ncbi:MAG TPA: NAD(+) synthase [Planctomycetota bacterium]|nr:NAD(+) synthase [Planctomycetota bacterium]
MTALVVAAAALNQIPLDWDGNQRRIVEVLRAARERGVGLLCLPELCITGYGCEDAFHGPDVVVQAERVLVEIARECAGLVVCVGLPRLHQRALFNTVAVIADGHVLGFVAKQHLAGDGIHYEPRWFKPWRADVVTRTRFAGRDLPLGDLLFAIGDVRIGFEICEDAWVAGRPGARLAAHGVDVVLNPSASHFAFGKLGVRRDFVCEGSRAFGAAYVYANLLGNEAGRAIYDGGALIADGGAIVAQGPRLTLTPWELTCARVDLSVARFSRARIASHDPALEEHSGLVEAAHAWPAAVDVAREAPAAWEASPTLKEEEFSRAEALALFDYLRKSRSGGFVVSLSGGADSAAVSCLVALAARRALDDLGAAGVREALGHIPAVAACADARALTGALLTTVWQGTANSSATTRDAARAVADAVGAQHLELDVEPFVQGYVRAVGAAVGRAPTWERDDLALQNIQARARAPGVWMIANLRNALLLATSNRSEAAVGYATMDGDTCGGLSPIAGIDKAFLRRWLSWLEREGPRGIGPIAALAAITAQRSTPELRPLAVGQKSEEDLMPFPLLDRIEKLAIRDKLPPVEVLARMVGEFPEHGREVLRGWVRRFFALWCRNQWKRERFAPAFHLDDENLDPKTWCRFPILNAGFARELRALDEA